MLIFVPCESIFSQPERKDYSVVEKTWTLKPIDVYKSLALLFSSSLDLGMN